MGLVSSGGVLAFSVSQRTRQFGIRLAVEAEPRHLIAGVLAEGAVIAAVGVRGRRGLRLRAGEAGGQLLRGRADARRNGRGRIGGRAAGRGGGCVAAARVARRAGGCRAGAPLRLT